MKGPLPHAYVRLRRGPEPVLTEAGPSATASAASAISDQYRRTRCLDGLYAGRPGGGDRLGAPARPAAASVVQGGGLDAKQRCQPVIYMRGCWIAAFRHRGTTPPLTIKPPR